MDLTEIKTEYKFSRKRNYKMVTPCCGRTNKDGKFVNFEGLPDEYGFCHSCGKTTKPPKLYTNENGEEVYWNDVLNKYEKTSGMVTKHISKPYPKVETPIKYIPDKIVMESSNVEPENALLYFIRNKYGHEATEDMIDYYLIGTDEKGFAIFWLIDANTKVRKSKVIQYNANGKRTSNILSPYLNEQGYKACLFGEHLLYIADKSTVTVVLVESEKTAIIASIVLPDFLWMAYGGINGLTTDKLKALIGYRVLIIPDMSENAVTIINKKIPIMKDLGIKAHIWDMTEGKTDDELKEEGLYNQDLEDVLRNLKK